VLFRLAYLGVTNVFALLRLLPVSDRDKDVEILALRHQITVLERQRGTTRPRFSPADRAFLAACCTGSRGTCWGFEPLTSCMPYKFRLRLDVAGCGSTSSFDRWTSPGVA
jgi:hypothetical protein